MLMNLIPTTEDTQKETNTNTQWYFDTAKFPKSRWDISETKGPRDN
jgi:hypothetical protein